MAQEARAVIRKQRRGVVVSDHGDKTIVVSVERASRHPLYHKVIRRTRKYHVHDPENAATNGDLVNIEECRPISKTKRWRLVEVLTERDVADVAPESIDETLVSDVQRTAARAAAEEAEAGTSGEGESAQSEASVEAPSDGEPDSETGGETDSETGGETDSETDSETGGETDSETGGETDSETGGETAGEAEKAE